MTLIELEVRVLTLEQKLSHLAEKVDAPEPAGLNAWIDQVHGTFQHDLTYRQAVRLGGEWRKSHRSRGKSRSRKIAAR